MSIETSLVAVLQPICPRVRPDRGEEGIASPYIVWQTIGGEAINAMDNSLPGQRQVLMQVSVWSKTRLESNSLIQAVEAATRASPRFVAQPQGEAIGTHEKDTGLYGSIQRFLIWGDR